MKWVFLICLKFCFVLSHAQEISICSWNIKDFGKSKSEAEIEFIANTIKSFDIIALQEVVAGLGGPQAVARLSDALNRKGAKWDYVISNATSGSPYRSERYAYLWKTKWITRMDKAFLDSKFSIQIEREPFICRFKVKAKTLTLLTFHATTKADHPEKEIKYLKFFPTLYERQDWVMSGDFNLSQKHSVFNPLKLQSFNPALINQKTSLKQKAVKGQYLASEFDNFFYNTSVFKMMSSGIIPIYLQFPDIKEARKISDHVPIFVRLSMN